MELTKEDHIKYADQMYKFNLQQDRFIDDIHEYKSKFMRKKYKVNSEYDNNLYKKVLFHGYKCIDEMFSHFKCQMEGALTIAFRSQGIKWNHPDDCDVYYSIAKRHEGKTIELKRLSRESTLTEEDIKIIKQNELEIINFMKECIEICKKCNRSINDLNAILKRHEKCFKFFN